MLPTPELEIARNLPAKVVRPSKPSATRAGWRRTTTRISTWSPGSFRAAAPAFLQRLRLLPLVGRFGRRSPDPARALNLLDAWEDELRLIYEPGPGPSHPVLIALRETIRAKDIPLQAFRDLLRAFRQDQTRAALRHLGSGPRLLRLFGESRGPAGALPLRLSR
jgi:hypothetical protein